MQTDIEKWLKKELKFIPFCKKIDIKIIRNEFLYRILIMLADQVNKYM